MVMTNETPYNQFSNLSQVPYSIISYLLSESELLWKLLNDNAATAWNDPDLTRDEKSALIYDGIRKATDCRVFMNTGLDDSWLTGTTILRISVVNGIPNNRVWGTMLIGFDIFCHYAVSTLSNYSPRDLAISQELFRVLNEKEVPGIGKLYFDARATSRCQLSAIGQIPYRGVTIIMATKSLG
jgi:hypothetical protein